MNQLRTDKRSQVVAALVEGALHASRGSGLTDHVWSIEEMVDLLLTRNDHP